MAERDRETTDPDERVVVFDVRTRAHLTPCRPELLDHTDAILDTVARPDFRRADPIPGREQFYRQHLDPRRWLRVIVDFNHDPAYIVTAFIQDNPPPEWTQ